MPNSRLLKKIVKNLSYQLLLISDSRFNNFSLLGMNIVEIKCENLFDRGDTDDFASVFWHVQAVDKEFAEIVL